jgi:hypothetical protein
MMNNRKYLLAIGEGFDDAECSTGIYLKRVSVGQTNIIDSGPRARGFKMGVVR